MFKLQRSLTDLDFSKDRTHDLKDRFEADSQESTSVLQSIQQTLTHHGNLMSALHAKLEQINLLLSSLEPFHEKVPCRTNKPKGENINVLGIIQEICKSTSDNLEEINIRLDKVDTRTAITDSGQQKTTLGDKGTIENHNTNKLKRITCQDNTKPEAERRNVFENKLDITLDGSLEAEYNLHGVDKRTNNRSIDKNEMLRIKEYLTERIKNNVNPIQPNIDKSIDTFRKTNESSKNGVTIKQLNVQNDKVISQENYSKLDEVRLNRELMQGSVNGDSPFVSLDHLDINYVCEPISNALNKSNHLDLIADRQKSTKLNENIKHKSYDIAKLVRNRPSSRKIKFSPKSHNPQSTYCFAEPTSNKLMNTTAECNTKSPSSNDTSKKSQKNIRKYDTNHNNPKVAPKNLDLINSIDRQLQLLLRDVYDVVEKEAHLTRQILTRDSRLDDRTSFEFHFRVMDFTRRVRSDVEVFSCPWFIPKLGTCVRGYVRFSPDGNLLVSLSDGRFPKVVGVPPQDKATLTFTVTVCNEDEQHEDLVLVADKEDTVDEGSQRERYGVWGVGAGRPSCEDLIQSGYVRRDFDVLVLKFDIKIDRLFSKRLSRPSLNKIRDNLSSEVPNCRRRSDSLPKDILSRRPTVT